MKLAEALQLRADLQKRMEQLASRLFRQAQTWALKSGAPASVKMTGAAYDLWQKLGDFCASL